MQPDLPTFQEFLWLLFAHRWRADVCIGVINVTAIENVFRNVSCYHIRGVGPCIIWHGFLSLRCECHVQVKHKYIPDYFPPPRSSLPITCLAATERGMELHVDISVDSNHSLYVSKWIDISFALGLHRFIWLAWPLGLNNPFPLCFGFCLCLFFFSPSLLLRGTQPESLWRFIFRKLLMTCTNNPFGISNRRRLTGNHTDHQPLPVTGLWWVALT